VVTNQSNKEFTGEPLSYVVAQQLDPCPALQLEWALCRVLMPFSDDAGSTQATPIGAPIQFLHCRVGVAPHQTDQRLTHRPYSLWRRRMAASQ
jgi:hypothetical protein